MKAVVAALMLPLVAMNMLGGLVGIVWLMVLGEWGSLGYALVFTMGGAFLCGLALMPGLLASAPGLAMYDKGGATRIFSYPLIGLGLLWTHVVMVFWALVVFAYFFKRADAASMVPTMLVAYLVATAPWSYMAQKTAQSDSDASVLHIFFLQASCVAVALALALGDWTFRSSATMLVAIMAVAVLVSAIDAFSRLRTDSIRRRFENLGR